MIVKKKCALSQLEKDGLGPCYSWWDLHHRGAYLEMQYLGLIPGCLHYNLHFYQGPHSPRAPNTIARKVLPHVKVKEV